MHRISSLVMAGFLVAPSVSFSENMENLHAIQLQLVEANGSEADVFIHFGSDDPATVSHWNTIGLPEPSGLGVQVKDHRSGYQVIVTPGSVSNTAVVSVESSHITEINKVKTPNNLSVELPITKECTMRYVLTIGKAYDNKEEHGPCGISVTWLH